MKNRIICSLMSVFFMAVCATGLGVGDARAGGNGGNGDIVGNGGSWVEGRFASQAMEIYDFIREPGNNIHGLDIDRFRHLVYVMRVIATDEDLRMNGRDVDAINYFPNRLEVKVEKKIWLGYFMSNRNTYGLVYHELLSNFEYYGWNMGEFDREYTISNELASAMEDQADMPNIIKEVVRGNTSDVRLALQNGESPNAKDKGGKTALMYACVRGFSEIALLLLENGALPNTNYLGWTALHYASAGGLADVVRVLLEKGADVNVQVPEGREKGTNSLFLASKYASEETALLLVAGGADVNVMTTGMSGSYMTPLMNAAQRGVPALTRMLVEKGAALSTEGPGEIIDESWGKITRHAVVEAARSGNIETLDILLAAGAGVEDHDSSQKTPLYAASAAGKPVMVKYLLGMGAKITDGYGFGPTALFYAAAGLGAGSYECVKILVNAGAEVSHSTRYWFRQEGVGRTAFAHSWGYTPLMVAAENNALDIAKYLLMNGARPDMIMNQSYSGLSQLFSSTAYDLAVKNGDTEMAALLRKFGGHQSSQAQR